MSNIKNKLEGKIYIDSRERERIVSAQKYFGHDNTEIKQLDVGDYIYKPNDSDKCCVCEVKQVHTDLFTSIQSRKLFRQVADMVLEFPIHYLLIVGNPEEEIIRNTIIKNKNPNYYWNFTLEQWDGAYTSLQQVTQIVFAYNWERALKTMQLLFKKSTDNKNRIYNYLDKTENTAYNYISTIKRIGPSTAELVCEELGLKTWKDLDNLNRTDLLDIKGIKNKKADIIMNAIG